jgi:hypothetical protein
MEPVFALPYSEYLAANLLSRHFKTKAGYSLFVPTSRQEQGIDLLLTKRVDGLLKSASFQVKSSRTYSPMPPKRRVSKVVKYSYYTWFNAFVVPTQADFFLLVGIYPPEENRTRKVKYSWWDAAVLLFTQAEMREFMAQVKTRKGDPDKMFGFGFDTPAKIILTRGDQERTMQDYSSHLFQSRIQVIETCFD